MATAELLVQGLFERGGSFDTDLLADESPLTD
jgi:hypothetical protein